VVFPVLNTKRLLLRQLDDGDYNEIFALRSNDEVNQYIMRTKPTNIEEVKSFIKTINEGIIKNNSLYWAICLNNSRKPIGTICLWNFSANRKIGEIGFELHPAYQGRGIMNEALASVINYGFNEAGLMTIEAYTHKDNRRSANLLKKNNFKMDESRLDQDDMNNVIYTLTGKS